MKLSKAAILCSVLSLPAQAQDSPVATFDSIAQSPVMTSIVHLTQQVVGQCDFVLTLDNQGHQDGVNVNIDVDFFCLGQQWPEEKGGLEAFESNKESAIALLQSHELRLETLESLAGVGISTDCYSIEIERTSDYLRLKHFGLFSCTTKPEIPTVEGIPI